MHIYVYICIYIYIYMNICVYICIDVYVCVHMYIPVPSRGGGARRQQIHRPTAKKLATSAYLCQHVNVCKHIHKCAFSQKKKKLLFLSTHTRVSIYTNTSEPGLFVSTHARGLTNFNTYELGHEDLCISILCEHLAVFWSLHKGNHLPTPDTKNFEEQMLRDDTVLSMEGRPTLRRFAEHRLPGMGVISL